jgi:hypothetical protein
VKLVGFGIVSALFNFNDVFFSQKELDFMSQEELVHKSYFEFLDRSYSILIYLCDGKNYIAKTEFGPDDMIINDGTEIESLLEMHKRLLPLAIISRKMRPKKD